MQVGSQGEGLKIILMLQLSEGDGGVFKKNQNIRNKCRFGEIENMFDF